MESHHSIATHPQFMRYLGDANSGYDVFSDYTSRQLTAMAVPSPFIDGTGLTQTEIYTAMLASSGRLASGQVAEVPEGWTARAFAVAEQRKALSAEDGEPPAIAKNKPARLTFIGPLRRLAGGRRRIMAFEGPIEDRLAIRERIEAYSDAVFRADAEAWIANWCDDAVWTLPGIDVTGKPAIKAAWIQAMSAFSLAAFFAAPGSIVVRGDTAKARVYTQEILVPSAGRGVRRIVGAYDDQLVKQAGVWLFSRRAYQIRHDQTVE